MCESLSRYVYFLLSVFYVIILQKHTKRVHAGKDWVYTGLLGLVLTECCLCIYVSDAGMSDFPVNPLVVIGIGSSFAFSGLFYRLYQEKKKELQKLKASTWLFLLKYSCSSSCEMNLKFVCFYYYYFRKYPFSSQISIWSECWKHLPTSDCSMLL